MERTIEVLKSRFRTLEIKSGGGIQYDIETAVNIIMACCVLHNYCRLRNMDFDVDEDIVENIADEGRLRLQYSQPREFIKFSNMFLLFFISILTQVIKLTNNPISIFTNPNVAGALKQKQ